MVDTLGLGPNFFKEVRVQVPFLVISSFRLMDRTLLFRSENMSSKLIRNTFKTRLKKYDNFN